MSLPRAKTPRGAASPAPSHKSYGRISNSPAPDGKNDGTFWEKVQTLSTVSLALNFVFTKGWNPWKKEEGTRGAAGGG